MNHPVQDLCNNLNLVKQSGNQVWKAYSKVKEQPKVEGEKPRELIPELCKQFYGLGWVSGTGGGLSIRQDGRIYCAPSAVQKERIQPEDMFVLDDDGQVLERPSNPDLKCSECLSLFMVAFKVRNAGCCIHSHSINANLVTSLCSEQLNKQLAINKTNTQNGHQASAIEPRRPLTLSTKEFRITNQEMIKGIKIGSSDQCLQYNDTLVVPIIDNVLHERDLTGAMLEAVKAYPDTNAVLVRNHGVYVWGKNWQQAKGMAECLEYLFRIKLEAFKYGFDWIVDDSSQSTQ